MDKRDSSQCVGHIDYNNAGQMRLTSANIGPHTYTYGFGAQNSAACGTGAGTNSNSGKNSNLPANTSGGSYAWVGQHEKLTETAFTLTPISMGARIYIPALGRFTQVDPIEGGTENNYVYPVDPVNEFDLTGLCMGRFMSLCTRAVPWVDKVTNKAWNKAVSAAKYVPKAVRSGWSEVKKVRVSIRLDGPSHFFRNVFNSRDKLWMRHLQVDVYKKGTKGSNKSIRIPYGPAYKLKNGKGGIRWR